MDPWRLGLKVQRTGIMRRAIPSPRLAALGSALGTDFDLSKAQGFDDAGRFRVYFTGPAGETFNYADGSAHIAPAAEMFWLARRFNNPVYAWQEQSLLRDGRPQALDLVWYQREAMTPSAARWPLQAVFSRRERSIPPAKLVGFAGCCFRRRQRRRQ